MLKNHVKRTPGWHQNSKRNQQHMLKMCQNWCPRTFEKQVFEWKGCNVLPKPEARTSVTNIKNKMSKYKPDLWKMDPGSQQKTMLKIYPNKTTNTQSNDCKSIPKNMPISGLSPLVPKWYQWSNNKLKIISNSPPDCENKLQKSNLFGAWPGGRREALTITWYPHNILRIRPAIHVLFVSQPARSPPAAAAQLRAAPCAPPTRPTSRLADKQSINSLIHWIKSIRALSSSPSNSSISYERLVDG